MICIGDDDLRMLSYLPWFTCFRLWLQVTLAGERTRTSSSLVVVKSRRLQQNGWSSLAKETWDSGFGFDVESKSLN